MSNLVQIGDVAECKGLDPLVRVIKVGLMPIVQIIIPIILIVFGIIDLGKAVIASDEKEIKAAQTRLIKRCVYAALIFFVVTIVTVIMNIVVVGTEDKSDNNWLNCWKKI